MYAEALCLKVWPQAFQVGTHALPVHSESKVVPVFIMGRQHTVTLFTNICSLPQEMNRSSRYAFYVSAVTLTILSLCTRFAYRNSGEDEEAG
jgi:hypothetical protein